MKQILELKSILTEMKISVEGLNSKYELSEERIREFKDRAIEKI